jgi:predicted helicase
VEKYDPILSERLKEERRNESQKNAERFFENYVNGIYENLNLEIDEEVQIFFLKNHLD